MFAWRTKTSCSRPELPLWSPDSASKNSMQRLLRQ
nr:MAG TPA: hypothetical protein [Caudoviricetes sp.]